MIWFFVKGCPNFVAPAVNESLRPKFLDLKEGAIVVSLQPFVSSLNARVTERNVGLVKFEPHILLLSHDLSPG